MITLPREATIRVTPTYLIITGPAAEVGYMRTPAGYKVEVRHPQQGRWVADFGQHNDRAWRYALTASGFVNPGVFADGDDVAED